MCQEQNVYVSGALGHCPLPSEAVTRKCFSPVTFFFFFCILSRCLLTRSEISCFSFFSFVGLLHNSAETQPRHLGKQISCAFSFLSVIATSVHLVIRTPISVLPTQKFNKQASRQMIKARS